MQLHRTELEEVKALVGANAGKELYKRLLVRFVLAVIFVGIAILVVPRLLELLYPFVFALIFAAILNPLVCKINYIIGKLHKESARTRKVITLVLNFLIVLALTLLIFYVSFKVTKELVALSIGIQQNWPSIAEKFDVFQERSVWLIAGLPPEVIAFLDNLRHSAIEFLQGFVKVLPSTILAAIALIITSTGSVIINFIMFFLSLYFFISDYHLIDNIAQKYVSGKILRALTVMKNSVAAALGGYLKAQLILALFAFVFMFISLGIYGQPYAFIIALLLGIVDLLPIIGTIAVLVPWGIIELLSGDVHQGVFLIIVGVAFFLVRRIVEPKVMGSQTGLHPLLALVSTYVGLKFSGVWGAILGPLVLMLLMGVAQSGILNNTVDDIQELTGRIIALLDRDAPASDQEDQ